MTRLTLEQANTIVDAALSARRAADAQPLAVVVLDDSGHVKSVQREDGASMFRPDIACGKAWGAVAMGESSRSLAQKALENPSFVNGLAVTSGGRLLPNPGGVLIRSSSGEILGAVGISGDSGPNDEKFAADGIKAAGLVADTGE